MSHERPRLFLIDDDSDALRVLARLLESEGYDARSTTSPEEALRLLGEEDYDAVLCDIWMPGMSGKDFYLQVRKSLPQYQNRFIVVTGDLASQYTWDFIDGRALPYVLKPFNLPRLLHTLSEVLGDRMPKEAPPDPSVEKRLSKRTAFKAPVRVRRQKFDPGSPDMGTTVNFSKDGLLFLTDQNYRVGTDIWVVFPYSNGVEAREQDGCVVRVEERDGKKAVAVALGEAASRVRQAERAAERRLLQIQKLSPWTEEDTPVQCTPGRNRSCSASWRTSAKRCGAWPIAWPICKRPFAT